MAKAVTKEPKITLEREYIVPLRKGWLKVPKYKRGNKAVKTLKQFIARHMKLYDTDLRMVKVDMLLNNEIRFRGMEKPPAKIKVRAKKFEDNIIRVELVDLPEKVKFKKLREEKKKAEIEKKVEEKQIVKKQVEEQTKKDDKKEEGDEKKEEETKEKKDSPKDDGSKLAKDQAKEQKHVSKSKNVQVQRKALSR